MYICERLQHTLSILNIQAINFCPVLTLLRPVAMCHTHTSHVTHKYPATHSRHTQIHRPTIDTLVPDKASTDRQEEISYDPPSLLCSSSSDAQCLLVGAGVAVATAAFCTVFPACYRHTEKACPLQLESITAMVMM